MREVVDAAGAPLDVADYIAVHPTSHVGLRRADLYRNGLLITAGLDVAEFDVNYDRAQSPFARATATIKDDTVTIRPLGDELRLWMGVEFRPRRAYATFVDYLTGGGDYLTGGGSFLVAGVDSELFGTDVEKVEAWVSLGFFGVQEVSRSFPGDGVAVDCEDRMRAIADALTGDAYVWTTADTLETKIEDVVRTALPSIPFPSSFQGTTHPAADVTHEVGTSPERIVVESAEGVGYEAFFDHNGVFSWRPEPDLRNATVVATFRTGEGGNVMPGFTVTESRRDVYNGSTVTGNNTASTDEFTATALDDDPASLTYYYGSFGQKPSSLLRDAQVDSQAKADASAEAHLVQNLGMDRVIEFSSPPLPVVAPGDAIRFVSVEAGIDEDVLVERQTLGGIGRPMRIVARTKRVVTM